MRPEITRTAAEVEALSDRASTEIDRALYRQSTALQDPETAKLGRTWDHATVTYAGYRQVRGAELQAFAFAALALACEWLQGADRDPTDPTAIADRITAAAGRMGARLDLGVEVEE